MYTVYILKSEKTNGYYIGYTFNLVQRLKSHNTGKNKSTKPGMPWNIAYTEEFLEKPEAWKRERQIKKYKGGEAFINLVGGVPEWLNGRHC